MNDSHENTVAKIHMPCELHRALRLFAAEERKSVSAVAREIFSAVLLVEHPNHSTGGACAADPAKEIKLSATGPGLRDAATTSCTTASMHKRDAVQVCGSERA